MQTQGLIHLLIRACEAVERYDSSIAGRATRGEVSLKEGGGGIAEGEDLDRLYLDMVSKTRAALNAARLD